MAIEVIVESGAWDGLGLRGLAAEASTRTFAELSLDAVDWDVALLASDDARIAGLNAQFRGKPLPTNVLSWPSEDRAPMAEGEVPVPPDPTEPELGDMALAYETCAREAELAGRPLSDHVTHLIVHGLLHLLGYDHVRDGDAALMEQTETQILGKMGLSDPYS